MRQLTAGRVELRVNRVVSWMREALPLFVQFRRYRVRHRALGQIAAAVIHSILIGQRELFCSDFALITAKLTRNAGGILHVRAPLRRTS